MTRTFATVDDACVFMQNCFYECELVKVADGWMVIVQR